MTIDTRHSTASATTVRGQAQTGHCYSEHHACLPACRLHSQGDETEDVRQKNRRGEIEVHHHYTISRQAAWMSPLLLLIFILAFILNTVQATEQGGSVISTSDPVLSIRHLLPPANLENNTVENVTVQLGAAAFLPCRFRHLADHQVSDDQVSWFRRRDWHILTTGVFTYTNDERFSVLHPEDSQDWTLQIKYTTRRDNGTYECQLSTGTGVISQFVNLNVVVPQAYIVGNTDYHMQPGSTIKLVCVIEKSPTPPQYVFWYHNENMINYDTQRGGINVTTQIGTNTKSHLTVIGATYEDSGNYTCSASNTMPASANVYVSLGDKIAAISRKGGSGAASLHINIITAIECLVFLILKKLSSSR